MSCFSCHHIYGHAADCQQGHDEAAQELARAQADLETLREEYEARFLALEARMSKLEAEVSELQDAKAQWETSEYWKAQYGL